MLRNVKKKKVTKTRNTQSPPPQNKQNQKYSTPKQKQSKNNLVSFGPGDMGQVL